LRLARSISACSISGAIAPDHARCHLILQFENVLEGAVEAVGPEVHSAAPWVPQISHEILRDLGMSDDA